MDLHPGVAGPDPQGGTRGVVDRASSGGAGGEKKEDEEGEGRLAVWRHEAEGAVRSWEVPSGERRHHHHHRGQMASGLGREGADPQWGAEIVPPVGAVVVEQPGGALGRRGRRRTEGVPDCRQVEGAASDADPGASLQRKKKEEEEEGETYRVQVRWGSAGETTAQTSAPRLEVGQD